MQTQKEIFVLMGGGHKGSVRITPVEGNKNRVRVECNLDFRPTLATLYIIGDEVAEMALKDSKTTHEVQFLSNNVQGCVVRSSSVTMFGGRLNKAEMLAKIGGGKATKQSVVVAENRKDSTTKEALKNDEMKADFSSLENSENSQREKHDERRNEREYDRESNLAKLLSATSTEAGVLKYNGSNFYLAIKPQLDEMFVCYKQEEALNNAVENSQWVHIDTEDGYYVVGLLKDGDKPSFICYGVPSYSGDDVPPELKNVCVWLPVDDEKIKGYWVIYQSAVDGDIVK